MISMEYREIIHEDKTFYGKHLMISVKNCNEKVIQKHELKKFVTELVVKIKMEKLGPIIVEKVDEKNIYDGYSIVQIIKTSTITMHTYHYSRDFYLDVFSCKDYDVNIILVFIEHIFEPDTISKQVIYRG